MESDGTRVSSGSFSITQPRRLIVVEPLLILATLIGFPLILISQLYVIDTIRADVSSRAGYQNLSQANVSLDLCKVNESDPVVAFNDQVQKEASYFTLISTVVVCIPALFVSLFIGTYSDKAGRKFAIIPPLVAGLVRTLVYIIVIFMELPVWYLLIGSFLDGCGGYFTTMLLGCFAYIADTTTPNKRRFRITVIEMCMFASAVVGPLGVGPLIEKMGYLYSFIIVIAGQFGVLLYAIFLVPETIQRDPEARFFQFSHIRRLVKVFSKKDASGTGGKLVILMIAFFLSVLPQFDSGVDTLFYTNRPLCLDPSMIGYVTSVYVVGAVIGGVILAWVFKYCLSDEAIALVSGLLSIGKNLYKAVIWNTLMVFFTPAFGMFSILYIPTIRALMSKMVTESEQGAVFGAIGCVEILCSIIGTGIFNPIYAATEQIHSGLVYVSMAGFYLAGCAVLLVFVVKRCRDKTKVAYTVIQTQEVDPPESDVDMLQG